MDAYHLNVQIGEASSQAVLETFAIKAALCCWQRKWLPQTPIVVLSDSTAALAALVKSSIQR
eukprot:3830753-Amphidinium_carterae.1